MSDFSKSTAGRRSTFPSSVQLPDVAGHTGKVFKLKTNPHWYEAETDSYARFDYYGICTGSKRHKLLDSGFGLMTALCYPDADLQPLGRTLDFVLWLFASDDHYGLPEYRFSVPYLRFTSVHDRP